MKRRVMKPKLKPQKGWRIRVIVCDNEGNIEYDDINNPYAVPPLARDLMDKILEKQPKYQRR